MLDTMCCAVTVVPKISNNLREHTTLIPVSGWLGQQRIFSEVWGLSHFESVKHDSNHRSNHGENDRSLDELFLERFLSKRLMIHLVEHVPIPLSANTRVGSLRDVRIALGNQLQD